MFTFHVFSNVVILSIVSLSAAPISSSWSLASTCTVLSFVIPPVWSSQRVSRSALVSVRSVVISTLSSWRDAPISAFMSSLWVRSSWRRIRRVIALLASSTPSFAILLLATVKVVIDFYICCHSLLRELCLISFHMILYPHTVYIYIYFISFVCFFGWIIAQMSYLSNRLWSSVKTHLSHILPTWLPNLYILSNDFSIKLKIQSCILLFSAAFMVEWL